MRNTHAPAVPRPKIGRKRRPGHRAALPISILFSPHGWIELLRVLVQDREPITGRALARAAGIGHQVCADAVEALEKMGVVDRAFHGKSAAITLNRRNILVTGLLLPFFNKEALLAYEIQAKRLARTMNARLEEDDELDP